jgi:hypothetical protein
MASLHRRVAALEGLRGPGGDPAEGRQRVMDRLDGIGHRLGDIEPSPEQVEAIMEEGRQYLQTLRQKRHLGLYFDIR